MPRVAMEQIQLRLPAAVIDAIDAIVPPRGRNAYIRQAIGLKLALDLKAAQEGERDLDQEARNLVRYVLRTEYQN